MSEAESPTPKTESNDPITEAKITPEHLDETIIHKMHESFPELNLTRTDGPKWNSVGNIIKSLLFKKEGEIIENFAFVHLLDNGIIVNYISSSRTEGTKNYGDTLTFEDKPFHLDELDLAIEAAKLSGEGVDLGNNQHRNQVLGWNNTRKTFVTVEEAMEDIVTTKQELVNLQSLYKRAPKIAKDLAIKRLSSGSRYSLFGSEIPVDKAISEVMKDTPLGETIIRREFSLAYIYQKLTNVAPHPNYSDMPYTPEYPISFEEAFPEASDDKPVKSTTALAQRLGFTLTEGEDVRRRDKEYFKDVSINGETIRITMIVDSGGGKHEPHYENICFSLPNQYRYRFSEIEDDTQFRDLFAAASLKLTPDRADFDKDALKQGGYTRLFALIRRMEQEGLYERKFKKMNPRIGSK